MGNQNCCSTRQKDSISNNLDKQDLLFLTDFFKHYSNQNQETFETNTLNSAIFQKILPDLPHLGLALYKFCSFQINEVLIPIEDVISISTRTFFQNGIQFSLFLRKVFNFKITNLWNQFLLLLSSNIKQKHKNSFNQQNLLQNRLIRQFMQLKILSQQNYKTLVAMYLFCFTRKSVAIDTKPLTFILFGIFGEDQYIDFPTFISALNNILPNFTNLIRYYFNHRLLQKPFIQMKIARFSEDSSILTKEWLAVLGIAHSDLHKFENLRHIYTSISLEYSEFYEALFASGQNSLLISVFYNQGQRQVFAIYNRVMQELNYQKLNRWCQGEQLIYDKQSCFLLEPSFQVYQPQDSSCYYLNEDGFGFARDKLNKQFLIWIGQDITVDSYSLDEGNKLVMIEIWKFDDQKQEPRSNRYVNDQQLKSSQIEEKSAKQPLTLNVQNLQMMNDEDEESPCFNKELTHSPIPHQQKEYIFVNPQQPPQFQNPNKIDNPIDSNNNYEGRHSRNIIEKYSNRGQRPNLQRKSGNNYKKLYYNS